MGAVRAVVVLLHSPLVGPATWHPVAERLASMVTGVVVPDFTALTRAEPPYHHRLAAEVASAVDAGASGEPVVLVGHSMGGLLVPGVMAELDRTVPGVVLVDSALPQPGATWFDTAPPELAEQLRVLAVDGRLPPWHRWFPEENLVEALPDADVRARFSADVPSLPVSFFEEPFLGARTWADETSCGYVLLSEPYREAADEAERRGWPVVRLDAHHLAPLTEPDRVTAALDALLHDLVP